ncbi:periplasmic mercury ion-binding protein [Limimaricola soesokkakensis]|uniref:periplasmic mercury ion-binding protein n=1 Tax=Limimaricola soesokkakensis TaxID=1343159 RepID=UPI0035128014
MNKFLLPLAIVGGLATFPAFAGEQQINISVSEMTCPTCSFTVASSMRQVPSVEIVDFQESATFGQGVFIVTYDDEAADAETIVDAVMANGYPAEVLMASN